MNNLLLVNIMIYDLKEKNEYTGKFISYLVQTEHLKFSEEERDCLFQVIEHLEDLDLLINEKMKNSKKEGKVTKMPKIKKNLKLFFDTVLQYKEHAVVFMQKYQ